ncbi:MAG: CDP-alcohol phosphatidyltransferase family protein [Alphaproteobacteria bacterium]|nr:CDP-alcohol phosphatidyltransferase family protein [Alphaproteobacteria bacterium]
MKTFVNFLSIFRIATAFALIPTMLLNWYLVSFILFLLGAISDWFDGYLARKYDCCSKIGGVLDHIGDKLLVCNTLILLPFIPIDITFISTFYATISGKLWFIIVPIILMIDRELYISGLREFLGTQKIEMPVPKARFSMGKIKTTLQMVAITVILLAVSIFKIPSNKVLVYIVSKLPEIGIAILWAALVISIWSAVQYTKTFSEKLKKIK